MTHIQERNYRVTDVYMCVVAASLLWLFPFWSFPCCSSELTTQRRAGPLSLFWTNEQMNVAGSIRITVPVTVTHTDSTPTERKERTVLTLKFLMHVADVPG